MLWLTPYKPAAVILVSPQQAQVKAGISFPRVIGLV